MQRIFWFDGVDPAARTNIEITLELGPDSANAVVLAQLSAILSDLNQRDICGPLFTLDAAFSECSAEGAIQPMFDDSFWNGPPVHRIGTGGTLVEWSLDAIGWFAETLAEVLASLGCTTPVIVTLRRNTPQATELASIQRA
ncbi:hypothetical protein [uncultured Aeromicrobium sp.]|uniref:hypothetical protein n=1 Tax=uncultured Aeromicrobium sp. TaxID=337820 RepID=UPI0025FCE345|nr:hypothetical protein [uncultured Aeromicrobium sp.]